MALKNWFLIENACVYHWFQSPFVPTWPLKHVTPSLLPMVAVCLCTKEKNQKRARLGCFLKIKRVPRPIFRAWDAKQEINFTSPNNKKWHTNNSFVTFVLLW